MLNTKNAYLFFLLLLLSSCKFECSTKGIKEDNSSVVKTTVNKIGDITLTNNINITSNTTKLESATLLFDNEERVPDDNVIDLNEKIRLTLVFSENNTWKLINGKYSLGASEKIVASDGTVVLNAGDLFKDYINGIDPSLAQVVKLSARITGHHESIKYYMVYFRVWDKNSSSEVTGNYKLYIRK